MAASSVFIQYMMFIVALILLVSVWKCTIEFQAVGGTTIIYTTDDVFSHVHTLDLFTDNSQK